jgi:hypothetical protein
MIYQRTLVFDWVGFPSMCSAAYANSYFYVDATSRPTSAKGQDVLKKEEFVI